MKKDIEKFTGDNLGGVYTFKFCFVEDIETIPPVYNGAIQKEVVLKPNTRWYDAYCTEGTKNLMDIQQPSEHGGFHSKEFSGIVPKDRTELIDLFNSIMNRKFVLDVTDNNGLRKLVGNIAEPLFINTSFDTKQDVPGRNEYKISFKGDGVLKSPGYNV